MGESGSRTGFSQLWRGCCGLWVVDGELPVSQVLGWSTLVEIPRSRSGDGGLLTQRKGGGDGRWTCLGGTSLGIGIGRCACASTLPLAWRRLQLGTPLLVRCCYSDGGTQGPLTKLADMATVGINHQPQTIHTSRHHLGESDSTRAHGSRGKNNPSTSTSLTPVQHTRPTQLSHTFLPHPGRHHIIPATPPADPLPRTFPLRPTKPNDKKAKQR